LSLGVSPEVAVVAAAALRKESPDKETGGGTISSSS